MSVSAKSSRDLIALLHTVVGDVGLVTDSADMAPYLSDWRGNYTGCARCVVRPANTAQVAQVVTLCRDLRIPIVPQGGNTGLVGGSVPDDRGEAVVVSLKRMNRILGVDTANNTLTAESGCVLATIQQTAMQHQRLFPLSLAAEGSCTIGGNLSTNAGGTAVLRYGNTRDLVLGLEAVLASGEIWNGLRGLRKDNTGYDLKQLFIGAEGTLGIVTAAVLKLFPAPNSSATALVAVSDPQAAVNLLAHVQGAFGARLTGFELMSRLCVNWVIKHFPATREPFPQQYPFQVLLQLTDTIADAGLGERLIAALEAAVDQGLALDAVIASSDAQASALWSLREHIPEAEKLEGKSVKHDISVPVSRIAPFIARCDAALRATFPDINIVCFGHAGDGNLHYNVVLPHGGNSPRSQEAGINRIVYETVDEMGGSISAEHGLGQLKREEITHHKSSVEMEMMHAVKRALDPLNLMNPGKLL
jgi:FAD/FMN-containing dehydrogenase